MSLLAGLPASLSVPGTPAASPAAAAAPSPYKLSSPAALSYPGSAGGWPPAVPSLPWVEEVEGESPAGGLPSLCPLGALLAAVELVAAPLAVDGLEADAD